MAAGGPGLAAASDPKVWPAMALPKVPIRGEIRRFDGTADRRQKIKVLVRSAFHSGSTWIVTIGPSKSSCNASSIESQIA